MLVSDQQWRHFEGVNRNHKSITIIMTTEKSLWLQLDEFYLIFR
jgi:hypothetical protein